MTYPSWWAFLLLALGAFRVTRLIGWDDLTIRLRHAVTGMGDEEHKQWAYVIDHQREIDYDPWDLRDPYVRRRGEPQLYKEHSDRIWDLLVERLEQATGKPTIPPIVRDDQPWPPVSERRYYLSKMIRCPWCLGFWVSLVVGLAWGGWTDAWLSGLLLAFPLSATVGLAAKNLDP